MGRRAEALRRIRRELAIANADLIAAESDLAERRGDIDALQAEQAGLERNLPGLAAAEARARALASSSPGLDQLVAQLPAAGGHAASPELSLRAPVQGELVRRFGHSTGGAGGQKGVSWRAGPAAEVLAPANARVEYVGPLKGYGLVVILTPSERFHLVLAGLDQAAAGAGRTVLAGEPIGRMAGDGSPELYLEVRQGGRPVDPARWLAAAPVRGARS
jgi:septal ring factor EnvC (AmiA/AmiB activator)